MSRFNYGTKRPNGQFPQHPTLPPSKVSNPLRNTYFHKTCKSITIITQEAIVNTFAKEPAYYSHTFCMGCRDYMPIDEFLWVVNGITTDNEVGK